MEIAINFDGTCVKSDYPNIGEDCPNAVDSLKDLTKKGHKLILNTMRSGENLENAVRWFLDKDIPLYGVQKNPTQHEWTSSPKVQSDIIIDSSNLGAMLTMDRDENGNFYGHPYTDWNMVNGFLKKVYNI